MSEESDEKSIAERWFEEQQAWQQTMREYADSMVKDEQFLTHLGNAMNGSLLAGTPYPQPPVPGVADPGQEATRDLLQEVLFALKRIDGRLRDLEDAVSALGGNRAASAAKAESADTSSER